MTQLEVALEQLSMRVLIGPRISRSEGEKPPKGTGECGLGLARGRQKRNNRRHARKTGKRTLNFNALWCITALVPMLRNVAHVAQNVRGAEALFVKTT